MKKNAPASQVALTQTLTVLLLMASNAGLLVWVSIAGPILLNANIFEPLIPLQFLAILTALFFSVASWVFFSKDRSLDLLVKITHGFFVVFLIAGGFMFIQGLIGDEQHQLCYAFLDFSRTPISCVTSYMQTLSLLYQWVAPGVAVVIIGLCGSAIAMLLSANDSKKQRTRKRP